MNRGKNRREEIQRNLIKVIDLKTYSTFITVNLLCLYRPTAAE